jgi:hypothetical protein
VPPRAAAQAHGQRENKFLLLKIGDSAKAIG